MDKRVDSFVDKFLEKSSSSHVDIRIHVWNFVNPFEITGIVYDQDVSNTNTDVLKDLLKVYFLLFAKDVVKIWNSYIVCYLSK